MVSSSSKRNETPPASYIAYENITTLWNIIFRCMYVHTLNHLWQLIILYLIDIIDTLQESHRQSFLRQPSCHIVPFPGFISAWQEVSVSGHAFGLIEDFVSVSGNDETPLSWLFEGDSCLLGSSPLVIMFLAFESSTTSAEAELLGLTDK